MSAFLLSHWSDILGWTVTILALLFGGGTVVSLLPKIPEITNAGFEWVKSHATIKGHEAASALFNRVLDLVRSKVLAYEGTIVQDLKEKAADGLTGEELAAEYKKMADQFQKDMKEMLTLTGLWSIVQLLLGGGTEAGVMKVLDTMKEAVVSQLPPSGVTAVVEDTRDNLPAKPAAPVAPAVPPPAAT